jgi:hypothetical protein
MYVECYLSLTSILVEAEWTVPGTIRLLQEKQPANISIGTLLGPKIVFVRLRAEKSLLSPGIGPLFSGSPVRYLIRNVN